MEYFEALTDPDFHFLRYAVLMGLFASVAFGVVGSYVVVKRISYLAGAIAHAILGGIGFALYAESVYGWTWLSPLGGALLSGIGAAVLIGWIRTRRVEREDSLIGAVWATGMALGLFFISATPIYTDPMAWLFGNILILSKEDLIWVLLLDLVLLVVAAGGYARLQAICFDEEFARLRGLHVGVYNTLLLCLVAMTIVLLVSVVGVILVVALLTLPPAIASTRSRSLWKVMVGASLLTLVAIEVGLAVSYLTDFPSGATIVLCCSGLYLAVRLLSAGRPAT